MITGSTLLVYASSIIELDANGYNTAAADNVTQIMEHFGVTRARANTAVARAARLARYQRTAEDDCDKQMTCILRIKVTERQRELVRMMADAAGTDISKLVRRKVFAEALHI